MSSTELKLANKSTERLIIGKGSYDFESFEVLKPTKPSKCQMLGHFARLAGPSVITNVFSYMVMTVNTIFAG